ncbi:unnamed protein product [Hymenolepis diminuta]|uniref:NAD(P)-binding protein n=1 Tax=Hymenolepis diminuta TaxID=6216 RepID=A0A0R3SHP7_HYMDI|nr:unnamed protein product [Hymenolepis diminuta]
MGVTWMFCYHNVTVIRIVNISSGAAMMVLHTVSKKMTAKVKDCRSLEELDQKTQLFVEYAHYQIARHVKAGFPNSPYGISKIGAWKAPSILANQFKLDPRRILINSCSLGYVDAETTAGVGTKNSVSEGKDLVLIPLPVSESKTGIAISEENADMPFYLVTLPEGVVRPNGEFVSERKVVDIRKRIAPLNEGFQGCINWTNSKYFVKRVDFQDM